MRREQTTKRRRQTVRLDMVLMDSYGGVHSRGGRKHDEGAAGQQLPFTVQDETEI